MATCSVDRVAERRKVYEDYLAAHTLFEAAFPSETLPVSTARCRRGVGAAEAGDRVQVPISQSVGPAVQQ